MSLAGAFLVDEFKAAGLPVHAVAGWETRSRSGAFTPIGAVMHHTASASSGGDIPALNTVTNGRSDLPGPLCNVLVGRRSSGLYVVAAGYANHAGLGGPWGTVPVDSGNRYFFGFEWENNGIDESWPSDQREIGRRAETIVMKHLKADIGYFIGHREWAPTRKIDPNAKFINMDEERREVAKLMANLGGDDMAFLTEGEQKQLKELLAKDNIYDLRNVLAGLGIGTRDSNSGIKRPDAGVYKQLGFDLMDGWKSKP